jgi:hypothetical protein
VSTRPPGGNCATNLIGPRVGQALLCAPTHAGVDKIDAPATNISRRFIDTPVNDYLMKIKITALKNENYQYVFTMAIYMPIKHMRQQ